MLRISRMGPRFVACLAIAATLFVSGVAWSADPIGRFSLSGRMGISGYDMGAVNSAISRSNQHLGQVQPEWDLPERIHSGFDFLGDLSYDLSYSLRLGLIYNSSSGKTDVDYLQQIKVEPQAAMITPRLFYRLPYRPMIDMSLRLFAGPVFLRDVKTDVSHEDTSEDGERLEKMTIYGSGTGFLFGLLSEYTLSDRFTLSFEGGYRFAKATFDRGVWSIPVVQDPGSDPDRDDRPNSVDLTESSYLWGFMEETYEEIDAHRGVLPTVRDDLDTDFSGVLAQIGLRIYFF